MSKMKQEPGSCIQCIEYIMYALNVLFFVVGGVTIGIGVWIICDKDFMSRLFGTDLMTAAAYLLVAGGVSLVLFSFVGCMASFYQNKCLLIMYFLVILFMFLVLMISGILGAVFRSQIGDELRTSMRKTIVESYGVDLDKRYNRLITEAWDTAQRELRCCAVDQANWSAYKGSNWYKDKLKLHDLYNVPLVPESCCEQSGGATRNLDLCQKSQQGPPAKVAGNLNSYLYYRGCYLAGRDFTWEYSGYIIGMAFGIACLMIAGMVFSALLFRQLQ